MNRICWPWAAFFNLPHYSYDRVAGEETTLRFDLIEARVVRSSEIDRPLRGLDQGVAGLLGAEDVFAYGCSLPAVM